jgi:hypothetical protein
MRNEEMKQVEKTNIQGDLFFQDLRQKLADVDFRNLGAGRYCVFFADGTTIGVMTVADNLFDVSIKTDEQDMEQQDINGEQLTRLLFNLRNASAVKDRKEEIISSQWVDDLLKEIENTPQPTSSGSVAPRTQNKSATASAENNPSTGSLQNENRIAQRFLGTGTSDLERKLKDILDDSLTMFTNNAGQIEIDNEDLYQITISPKGGNLYDVEIWTANGRLTEKVQQGFGAVVQFVFGFCSSVFKVEDLKKQFRNLPQQETEDTEEVNSEDVYAILRELAEDSGMTTDILRNRDLISLREGLLNSQSKQQVNEHYDRERLQKLAGIPTSPKATSFRGHPISLNEHRDTARPYADTMNGKTLIYVPGQGAVFVDRNQLPRAKFLSYGANGIEMVEGAENVKRPCWKPHQFRHY